MPRLLPIALALFASGCVPVTNPVGDIQKAKPDEALVGTWVSTKNPSDVVRFEVKKVKGVPEGLMPMTPLGTSPESAPYWVFVSEVGKEKFGNLCMNLGGKKNQVVPDFGRPGEYEHWAGSKDRVYLAFRYSTGKDEITMNFGDADAFQVLAMAEKLKEKEGGLFETPPGWLEKYLAKNGSAKLFPDRKDVKFKRKK